MNERELVFLEPDKGKGTVIMDKSQYKNAIISHLEAGPYKKIKTRATFPVDKLQRQVSSGLRDLKRRGLIEEGECKKFMLPNPSVPAFSCFPKTHKEGNKIRPVVSNINSPASKISEWLVRKFKKFKKPESFSVKNSFEMAEIMSKRKLENYERLVSFDVEALFPSIPIDEAFNLFKGWIANQEISDEEAELCVGLMEIVLNQRWFQFDGEIYEQLSGLFIGNPLSPLLSELVVGNLEMRLKNMSWFPKLWMRYVDDVLAVVTEDKIELTLNNLNKQHDALNFTMEVEKDETISFLDTKLIRGIDGIEIDIFRKSTDAPLCIPNNSQHHFTHKHAAFESLLFRMWKLPLSQESRERELNYLKMMARLNGYDDELIKSLNLKQKNRCELRKFTTLQKDKPDKLRKTSDRQGNEITSLAILPFVPHLTSKIEKILKSHNINVAYANRRKLKDVLEKGKNKKAEIENSGIYEIECKGCEKIYIGQTKRKLATRDKEHQQACKSKQIYKSSVAKHCVEEGHEKGKIRLLTKVDNPWQLDIYESIHISKNYNLMNEQEAPMTSKLFKFCKFER